MRKIVIMLTILVIIPIFSIKASAESGVDEYINDLENSLPEGFGGLTSDTEMLTEMAGFRSLMTGVVDIIMNNGGRLTSFVTRLVGILLLMSVGSFCHDGIAAKVESAVGIISTVIIFESVGGLYDAVMSSLHQISSFFAALIPITVGITALGGGISGAGVQSAGMYTTLSVVSSLATRIFSAVSSFGLAMGLLSALGNEHTSAVCRGVKELLGRISGIFTALISGAFSLQTLIASAADSASIRAVKYAASGLIPVVGSTVSGAISTLAAGLAYAKGIVGGAGIVVIIYLAMSPLVLMLLYRLSLSCAMTASEFVGAGGAARIFSSYRFGLDMTLTVYALSALIYLFEIIVFIRMGVSLS